MFEELCGKGELANISLVTTMWDSVPDEASATDILDKLESNEWKPLINQGSKVVRYHNGEESAWDALIRIIQARDERTEREVQAELEDLDALFPSPGPARVVFEGFRSLAERQKTLRLQLQTPIKRANEETSLDAIKKEYAEIQIQLEAAFAEMRMLLIPISDHFCQITRKYGPRCTSSKAATPL
ncbi:hypothetical protein ONZ45_g11718 [Pleurotus djamor]|nr:hypothetical protein ONZ45_g11718 [Pleurotus djamor]